MSIVRPDIRPLPFLISEAKHNLSRESSVVAAGQRLLSGAVVALTEAVSLVTTADTQAGDRTLSNIADTAGLASGRVYRVSGPGIAPDAAFTAGDGPQAIMNKLSTADGVGVAVTIAQAAGKLEAWQSGRPVAGILGHQDATGDPAPVPGWATTDPGRRRTCRRC